MTKCFKKKLNLLMYKKVTEKDKKIFISQQVQNEIDTKTADNT